MMTVPCLRTAEDVPPFERLANVTRAIYPVLTVALKTASLKLIAHAVTSVIHVLTKPKEGGTNVSTTRPDGIQQSSSNPELLAGGHDDQPRHAVSTLSLIHI